MATTKTDDQPLNGRKIGQAAHQLIGEILGDGLRNPAPEQLFARVGSSQLVRERVSVYRQAAKQRLLAATSLYFRLFAPEDEWSFEGCEVGVPGARLDLLWRDGAGGLMADEIKTGAYRDVAKRDELESQLARAVAGGVDRWGPKFIGVRAVLLGAPRKSFIRAFDGARTDLEWELV